MTKDQLATCINNAMHMEGMTPNKGNTVAVIEAFGEAVINAVSQGQTVTLRGFGTFLPQHRPARKARNFTASSPLEVPARTVPVFRPSDDFKERLRLVPISE